MVSLDDLRKEELNKNHKIVEIKLTLDNPSIRLENIYFWMIDYLRDGMGLNLDKISDVFGGSEGSTFFGDISNRMWRILDNVRNLGATINTMISNIISLLNEARLRQSRIQLFNEIKSNDLKTALSAYIKLKQIWESEVDARSRTSLVNLSSRLGFSTLLDIFYLYEIKDKMKELLNKKIISDTLYKYLFPSEKDPNKKDEDKDIFILEEKKVINKKVSDIAKSKLIDFYNWLEVSDSEYRRLYNVLKGYILHQINSLMLYIDIARPYFRFARKLLQKEYDNPDVVTLFETAILEIDLLAYGNEISITEWDDNKKEGVEIKYYPVYDISIKARLRPTSIARTQEYNTMYTFFGRYDFVFRTYILKKEELDEIRKNEELKDLAYLKGLEDKFFKYEINEIFNIFLGDIIFQNNEVRNKLKEKFNIELNNYSDLDKFVWKKEVAEEVLNYDNDLKESLSWLLKYLPSNKEENRNNDNNKEGKKEENKKEGYNPFSILLEPAVSLYESFKPRGDSIDSLSNIFEPILKNIVMFNRDESKIILPKKKEIQDSSKKEKEDMKKDAIGNMMRIYNSFKGTFGLLT